MDMTHIEIAKRLLKSYDDNELEQLLDKYDIISKYSICLRLELIENITDTQRKAFLMDLQQFVDRNGLRIKNPMNAYWWSANNRAGRIHALKQYIEKNKSK